MSDINKQIEELTKDICEIQYKGMKCAVCDTGCNWRMLAEALYNIGYCKQRVGEWTRVEVSGKNYGQVYYQHKDCEVSETQLFPSPYNLCPNCGAKMKGGAI